MVYVEVHRRLDGGGWLTDLLREAWAELGLDAIGASIPHAEIYANVPDLE